jgi:hypothetical protein
MKDSQAKKVRRRFRRGALIMLGVGTFGIAGASAASLGGLTSSGVGAENGAVTSCDTDGVSIAYATAYDTTAGLYKVSTVTVSGLAAACSGKTLNITLYDAANASLGAGTATIAGTSQVVTMSPNANAKLVVGAALVVTG